MLALDGAFQRFQIDALRADRNANQARAGSLENLLHPRIDGLFEQHRLAIADERALEQMDGLLAAAGDENVVGVARQAFGASQIEQVAAQRWIAGGRSQLENRWRFPALDYFFAGGAKIIQRKQQFRGPRAGETGQRCRRG